MYCLYNVLQGHAGCVNCLTWNEKGRLVIVLNFLFCYLQVLLRQLRYFRVRVKWLWLWYNTLHYIIVINVFKEKSSVTLQELNAFEKMSFRSTSENR